MSWGSKGEYLPTTRCAEDIPGGDKYVYHVLPRVDFASVMTEGFRPSRRSDKWDILHAYLDYVASCESVETCPESRSNCVFCHDRKKYGVNAAGDGSVTAVIDTSVLSNSIYMADREMATVVARMLNKSGSIVLSSESVLSEGHQVQNSDVERAYHHAVQYWESCCQYNGGNSEGIRQGITEVLIESSIPENAILTFYVSDD